MTNRTVTVIVHRILTGQDQAIGQNRPVVGDVDAREHEISTTLKSRVGFDDQLRSSGAGVRDRTSHFQHTGVYRDTQRTGKQQIRRTYRGGSNSALLAE